MLRRWKSANSRPPVAPLSKTAAAQSGHSDTQVGPRLRDPRAAGMASKVYSHEAIRPGMNGVRGPILRTSNANRRPGSAAVTTHSVVQLSRPRLLVPLKTSPS